MGIPSYDEYKKTISIVFFGGYYPLSCQNFLRSLAKRLENEMDFKSCKIVIDLPDLEENSTDLTKNTLINDPNILERKRESVNTYDKSKHYAKNAQIAIFIFRPNCPSNTLNIELLKRQEIGRKSTTIIV